jgi:hypothetical protein
MIDENQYNPLDASPPSAAVLLRLEADGELPEAWRQRLDETMQADPHAEDRIAFERALKLRVSKVMAQGAPAGLAERVRASLADADPQAQATTQPRTREVQAPSAAPAETSAPVYSFRQRLTRYALAAVLTLLVGVSGFLAWEGRNGLPSRNSDITLERASTKVFNFVDSQARVCGDLGRHFRGKMKCRALGEVPSTLSEYLGIQAPAQSLANSGYRFEGAGKCAVPYYGPSLHYVYTREASAGAAAGRVPLSLFVQHGQAPADMSEGSLYELVREGAEVHVYTWCDGELIYYLVPAPGDDVEEVLQDFSAPTTRVDLGA